MAARLIPPVARLSPLDTARAAYRRRACSPSHCAPRLPPCPAPTAPNRAAAAPLPPPGVTAFVLKDAADRGRLGASTFKLLNLALAATIAQQVGQAQAQAAAAAVQAFAMGGCPSLASHA